jgi:hypothetical protein
MDGHVYLIGDPNRNPKLTLTLLQLKFAMAGLFDGGRLPAVPGRRSSNSEGAVTHGGAPCRRNDKLSCAH